jgi:glycosyltransferase involved in cell wall biosynthesis
MGGSLKLALEMFLRLPTLRIPIELWGISPSRKTSGLHKFQSFVRVSHTDHLPDFWFHLWMRVVRSRLPEGAIVQVFRLDFLLPFLLFHRDVRTVAILDQSLSFINTEFRLLRGILSRAFRIMEAFCLQRVDWIVTDRKAAAYYSALYPWVVPKIKVRSTGLVDLGRFSGLPSRAEARATLGINPKSVVVVFIGRLEAVKNLDLLFSSLEDLAKLVDNPCLIVVGRGSHMARLKSRPHKGFDVRFLGELPYDRIPQVLRAADVLALTSIQEGSPTVVREALAACIPVVSTDVGDVSDLLTHPTRGAISPADPKKFASTLFRVISTSRSEADLKIFRNVSGNESIDDFVQFMVGVYASAPGSATTSPEPRDGQMNGPDALRKLGP